MKSKGHQITAVFLALLFLVASNSYAINSHFCGEFLIDVSYFGNEVSCGMEMVEDDCDTEKKTIKKKCCSETLELIDTSVSDFSKNLSAEYQTLEFVACFLATFPEQFIQVDQELEFFADLPPPKLEQDLQVLYQTFLI